MIEKENSKLNERKLIKILSEMGYSVEFGSNKSGLCIGNKRYD